MVQITERIFISGANLALAPGVTGLLNVAIDWNPQGFDQFDFEYNKVGLVDGPGNLPGTMMAAMLMLEQMLERNSKVVVCCHMGASRSPAVVALYIAYRSKDMMFPQALGMVKARHEAADPCEALRTLAIVVLHQIRKR